MLQRDVAQSRSGPLMSTFSNVQTSPKWSMRGKATYNEKGDTPGPGSYTADGGNGSKFGKSPNYGFAYASRDGIRPQSAPGPGEYNRPVNPSKEVSAKFGFGKSDRQVNRINRDEQPGPASYKIPGKMGSEGPKYSSGSRRENNRNYETPGPGAYQPLEGSASNFTSPQKWGFGTSPRDCRGMGGIPGPGSYDSSGYVTAGPKFSMKARNECLSKDSTPGPGEYGAIYTCFG